MIFYTLAAVLCVSIVSHCFVITADKSVKDKYCDSDFAVRARVVSNGYPTWGQTSLYYYIVINETYKGQDLIPLTESKGDRVFTNSGQRGVTYVKNDEYIISGWAKPGTTLSTYTDNINANVKNLTPELKEFFVDGQYKNVTC